MNDSLAATAVQQALQTKWLGRTYHYLPHTGSTNDLLKARIRDRSQADLAAGAVYLTDFQESGRGRMERRWQAPASTSLLFSILLRPAWRAERLAWLPMLAGLAVAQAVETVADLPVRLKWPNDLVIWEEGTWRKFCGMLLESEFREPDQLSAVILGIGVNVNVHRDQLPATSFPATSLLAVQGKAVSRLELLVAILAELEDLIEGAEQGQSPQPAWNGRLIMLNEVVGISRLGQEIDLVGVFEGTDEQGRLRLRGEDGRLHFIAAGDISLRAL